MTQLVKMHCEDGVCTLTLNRPDKLNAIDRDLTAALAEALRRVQALPAVRVIILEGEGRAFCAGNDLDASEKDMLEGFSREHAEQRAEELQDITRLMCLGDKIVIAAVQGWAVGAGLEWVINCDFSVWGESAQGFFPEIRLGVFPTGGVMTLLPRIVGINKAREMLLLGDRFSAGQMVELGLATRVVNDDEVGAEARRLAESILELPGARVAHFKKTLAATQFLGLEETLDLESAGLVEALLSADDRM